MQALFIGQTYIDVTFITDALPVGDEKTVAQDYAISFGGNAVTAAFCCAKLGLPPDLLTSIADDWLGRICQQLIGFQVGIAQRQAQRKSGAFAGLAAHGNKAFVQLHQLTRKGKPYTGAFKFFFKTSSITFDR